MNTQMTGLWGRIRIYCLNHDKPRKMSPVRNIEKMGTMFWGCDQYIPEIRGAGEAPCPNRLNMDDYQGIVLKFFDIVEQNGGLQNDLTNFTFNYRGGRQKVSVRCLKYDTGDEIWLGIFNQTVLGGGK